MLYYNFKNYEEFKERFGIQEHGNGEKSRKNKILLSFLKNKELLHEAVTTGNFYLLHISNMSVLRAPNILMSWGLDPDTVGVVETGLKFHVQGFKHTGTVEIKLNEGADLYEIYLYEESGEMKESHTDIYVDQLVDTIDRAVEYTGSDYEKKVNETYPGLHDVQRIVIV